MKRAKEREREWALHSGKGGKLLLLPLLLMEWGPFHCTPALAWLESYSGLIVLSHMSVGRRGRLRGNEVRARDKNELWGNVDWD